MVKGKIDNSKCLISFTITLLFSPSKSLQLGGIKNKGLNNKTQERNKDRVYLWERARCEKEEWESNVRGKSKGVTCKRRKREGGGGRERVSNLREKFVLEYIL